MLEILTRVWRSYKVVVLVIAAFVLLALVSQS